MKTQKLKPKQSAEDIWREHLSADPGGGKCPCGLPGSIRIRVFAPLDEMFKRMPDALAAIAAQNNGQVPVIEFKHGKHVRVGMAHACEICASTAEKEAAKGPSWMVVEIERGPGKDRPTVSVK